MANIFVNIPVVVGVGAPVDISAMGAEKTIVISGPLTGALTLEISEDAGVSWSQIFTFTKTGKKVLSFAANRIRTRSSSGGGMVNIGANDDGGLYVTIPAPAANGIGAAVDISALGNFTTVAVQGTFGGGVIGVQVSEDGVAFAEFATFAGPDSVTKSMVGDFVRAVSRGASGPGGPFAPVCSMGAINDASTVPTGDVASSCFIYQPGGGGTGPAVFDSWTDLYSALQAARAAGGPDPGGCFSIEFDNSVTSPTVVPAGAWDMDSVEWKGLLSNRAPGTSRVDVQLADGALTPNLRHVEMLRLTSLGASPVALTSGYVFRCIDTELASAGDPFLDGSALVNLDRVTVFVDDTSVFGDGELPVILMPVEGTVAIFNIDGGGLVEEDALDFSVGTSLEAFYLAVSAKIDDTQTAFLGGLVVQLPSTWRYRNNGRNIGPITVDAEVGDIVRCDPTSDPVEVDLPAITMFNDGQTVAVCNVTATTGTINTNPAGADTIRDAAGPFVMNRAFESIVLVADFQNLNWDIVSCCDGPEEQVQ